MKGYFIKPGGEVLEIELPDPISKWAEFYSGVATYIDRDDPLELVSVLFNDKPATMFVSAIGASLDRAVNPKGQLPANVRATALYWTGTIKGITGVPFDPLRNPMIHGNAVLIEVSKREL